MSVVESETAQEADAFRLRLDGRILCSGGDERSCVLDVVQGRQATFLLSAAWEGEASETAVAYVDLVGRLEGPTMAVGRDRITLTIKAPDSKWARLRQQFAVIAGMEQARRENLRGHGRLVPEEREVRVTAPDNMSVSGLLRDLSRSGAAIEAAMVLRVGDLVTIGATRGRVARLFDGGFAVQFCRLLPLERFNVAFRL